jgi:dynactin-4
VRATNVSVPDDNGQATPRKAYYLACGFCRWTSRDIGLKDQFVANGGWPELENPSNKRISTLLTYYRQLAQREKLEREKKKYSRRKSYFQLSDKFGLGAVAARRRSAMIGGSLKDIDNLKIDDIEGSVASETCSDELTEDFFSKPIILSHVTSISQRHASPEFQPTSTDQLHLNHKHLLIKQSLRCKECDHNLCKPEYNPSSIKFKIQLVAVHHVPELRIYALPNFRLNQCNQVILTLTNPLDVITHVTLLPCDPEADKWSTAKVELPQAELVLNRCDDAAEFDDGVDAQQNFDDDPSIVVFRKANKIGFFINVTPELEGDVKVSFRMKHDYRNIVSSSAAATPTGDKASLFGPSDNIVWLEHVLCIDLSSRSAY